MELLKYLQRTKWISRRDFESMIRSKAVKLDDKIVTDINQLIEIWNFLEIDLWENNIYEEKIQKFPFFKKVIISFNKPKGFVVSKDDKNNKTIFELLPKSWKKDFYYIWRLDKDSHGLLLLTNSPELVNYFENPQNKIIKIYEVKINKLLKDRHISIMKKWIQVNQEWEAIKDVEDSKKSKSKIELLKFYDITKIKDSKKWQILRILLKEWKKRHIRRLLSAFGYKVIDLKRVKVWKYEIWNIKVWKYMINKNISLSERNKYNKKNKNQNL